MRSARILEIRPFDVSGGELVLLDVSHENHSRDQKYHHNLILFGVDNGVPPGFENPRITFIYSPTGLRYSFGALENHTFRLSKLYQSSEWVKKKVRPIDLRGLKVSTFSVGEDSISRYLRHLDSVNYPKLEKLAGILG